MITFNCDIIFEISKYLVKSRQKSFLLVDKESSKIFTFKEYKIQQIQRWWRTIIMPCINTVNWGYKISIQQLMDNPERYKNRYIETLLFMTPRQPNWETLPHKPNPIFYKAKFAGIHVDNTGEKKLVIGGDETTYCAMYNLHNHKMETNTILNHTLIWWNETSYTWQHDCEPEHFIKGAVKLLIR